MQRRLLTILALSANLSLVGCADEQARTQIADTNARISQLQESIGLIGTKVSNQKLVDIINKLDDLQSQIDQLNGKVETLKHDQQTYQNTQDQLNQSLQQQVQGAPSKGGATTGVAVIPAASNKANASSAMVASNDNISARDEDKLKAALKKVKQHDFPGAIQSLKSIIKTSTNPQVKADAMYYLSVTYAASGQYKSSMEFARTFLNKNPNSDYAPDALRTIYISETQLGLKKSAANTAKTLIKKYPDSEAAQKVKAQLGSNN